ncbi:M20 family metallopeptidase [Gordonia sp. (in: high G+C Gram-positive bacteria)]|uniref:M20 family metallopeptidase n=1 Tax=Gordonia sp. (in: high G+C Gram-positive bacteria) TaxID=84139 RepID=UPI0016A52BC8|nr:M20 family metallopeptidase [Gordonia sp. (in: high G+C Gram-positive bacteria)]NLG45740.1 M20 family metallopeptidase [Gordonia sp. (in: high G+C Gram-positive bacteria)]
MNTRPRKHIDAVVASVDAARIEALTCSLVAAPSVNPGGTEEEAVAVLAQACRDAGFEVEISEAAPGRPNLIATVNGDATGPGLMFLGHSDVVPPGPGWTGDPFIPRRDGDLVIGRGTSDMKGGIAAAVEAMVAVGRAVDQGVAVSGPIRLVVTVDEEEHGVGVRHLINNPPPGEYLGCIVAEPTRLEVVRGCRGASYFDIDVAGRAAHSGRPSDGASAIEAAAKVIALIDDDQRRMAADPDPLLGYGTWNVGTIEGGQGISVVAPNCHMGVDRRLMPGEDVNEIGLRLAGQIRAAGIDGDGIEVVVTPTMYLPGFATAEGHPLVTETAQAVRDSGAETRVGGWSAACDGGWTSNALGIPTIVMGPGDINGQAHQPDESVELSELVTAAQAYVRTALALLS